MNRVIYDRLKESFLALIGMATPRIDYFTTYRGKVVKQSADGTTVDLKPDDARIPGCSDIPIKWGIPGVTALITPGTFMQLGWENGDPGRPFAGFIEGATVTKLVLEAQQVYLGAEQGAKRLVTVNEFNAHTHKYNPGPGTPVESVVPTVPAVGTTAVSAK